MRLYSRVGLYSSRYGTYFPLFKIFEKPSNCNSFSRIVVKGTTISLIPTFGAIFPPKSFSCENGQVEQHNALWCDKASFEISSPSQEQRMLSYVHSGLDWNFCSKICFLSKHRNWFKRKLWKNRISWLFYITVCWKDFK